MLLQIIKEFYFLFSETIFFKCCLWYQGDGGQEVQYLWDLTHHRQIAHRIENSSDYNFIVTKECIKEMFVNNYTNSPWQGIFPLVQTF
jgi:hypothetical protein